MVAVIVVVTKIKLFLFDRFHRCQCDSDSKWEMESTKPEQGVSMETQKSGFSGVS